MLVVGLGDPKPAPLPSSHHAELRRSRQTEASAKKAPKKLVPREFPPCSSDAPTAGYCTPIPPTSFASLGATIFRGVGRHGARRYRRRNSPPIRDTSRRATQMFPRAARSYRGLPRDLVYAGEAVGGREDRPGRHGVGSRLAEQARRASGSVPRRDGR